MPPLWMLEKHAATLPFRQLIDHVLNWRFGSKWYDTEAFRLAIGAILKELHFDYVGDAEAVDCVYDVLVGGPLESDIKSGKMIKRND